MSERARFPAASQALTTSRYRPFFSRIVFQYGFWKSRNQYSPAPGIFRLRAGCAGWFCFVPGA